MYQIWEPSTGWRKAKKAECVAYIREHFPIYPTNEDVNVAKAIRESGEAGLGADNWYCRYVAR